MEIRCGFFGIQILIWGIQKYLMGFMEKNFFYKWVLVIIPWFFKTILYLFLGFEMHCFEKIYKQPIKSFPQEPTTIPTMLKKERIEAPMFCPMSHDGLIVVCFVSRFQSQPYSTLVLKLSYEICIPKMIAIPVFCFPAKLFWEWE